MNGKISIDDYRFLVDGLKAYGFTKQGVRDWYEENKDRLTPEFMAKIRSTPDRFFYDETHPREDDLSL
jgi:hypothetical protein